MNAFLSGINLLNGSVEFMRNSTEVTLFMAYLKIESLKRINSSKKIKQIIVRWQIQDLVVGASDLEVYYYCKENNIPLFRNTRIHLKAFWDNNSAIYFGSANLTEKGIFESGNYNFELNGIYNDLDIRDRLYLNKIVNQSEYVDDILFKHIESLVSATQIPSFNVPESPTQKRSIDFFLISQLPMTYSPERLFEIYSEDAEANNEEINCAIHDIEIFDIPIELNKEKFLEHLSEKFNNHPFILSFKSSIANKESKSMRFGEVRRWFVNNTTTVPVPRPWDLNVYISTLYTWICFFDSDFSWSVPGSHSEVIFYNGV